MVGDCKVRSSPLPSEEHWVPGTPHAKCLTGSRATATYLFCGLGFCGSEVREPSRLWGTSAPRSPSPALCTFTPNRAQIHLFLFVSISSGGGAELTEWMGSVIPTPPKIGTPSFQSRELWVCGYGLSYRLFVPRDSSLGELSWRDIIV